MSFEPNFSQLYNLAYVAYGQGDYQEAHTHIELLATKCPYDPNVLLLQGHVLTGLERYDQAKQNYEAVLQLTDRPELVENARQALENLPVDGNGADSSFRENGTSCTSSSGRLDSDGHEATNQQWEESTFTDDSNVEDLIDSNSLDDAERDWEKSSDQSWQQDHEGLDWDSAVFTDENFGEPTIGQEPPPNSNAGASVSSSDSSGLEVLNKNSDFLEHEPAIGGEQTENPATPVDIEEADWSFDTFTDFGDSDDEHTIMPDSAESTFVVASDPREAFLDSADLTPDIHADSPSNSTVTSSENPRWQNSSEINAGSESSTTSDEISSAQIPEQTDTGPQFETFDDDNIDDLPDFDLTDIDLERPESEMLWQNTNFNSAGKDREENISAGGSIPAVVAATPPGLSTWLRPDGATAEDFSSTFSPFNEPPSSDVDPGWLGWFTNASLFRKQLFLAIISGTFSGVAVLILGTIIGFGSTSPSTSPNNLPQSSEQETTTTPAEKPSSNVDQPSLLGLALLTSLTMAIAVFLINRLFIQQVKTTIDDLQNQFESIYKGNFNVRAKVRSEDELGTLAQRFNYISQVILSATSEAQERATATEKVRKKLQRQVIRLLDDVEGASRGDLTVQAEVTADELGAVADSFNLTIQNLREIVLQVKNAAKQVNKNCTDSESFARNNSSDALRMAEELVTTLDSVHLMTESIERVAENAREAEEVAHTSSLTALKGGEAVERTVGGILQIRETVSETARKVKRLAEASQEISKIVAVISQIASRTNLLALNASIQAARAGEAGRGFAVVADEVRQLADRSAKSLKEIEQIVLQIQSETGSVMAAMEEGIQQVIDVTDKSEQSKRALEDIIEVSNRINTLVRSITADTVKQQENSGAVSQVMQSIELTAQETSQESQRVAGSLQTLVSISQDLLTSVERFRVDSNAKP